MRKGTLLLLGLYCLIIHAYGQTTVEDSINISRERWRDSMFRIDLTQVPTGFLLDYSLVPFDANKYDGGAGNDTIADFTRIFQLHNILSLSKVNGNASIQNTDSLFNQAVTIKMTGQSIPFIVLFKQYSRMRSTAVSEVCLMG